MKLRRLIFRFLALFVLSTGAFFVLSDQNVKANGTFCQSTRTWCYSDCDTAYWTWGTTATLNPDVWDRCNAVCNTNELGCLSAVAWDDWLYFVNLNIGENFLIVNEPNPICATYPDALVNCGSYETAVEVEACMLMVQQEQAHNNCP